MFDPNDYTVGWICALSTEYVAAQAFLDEEHEGPEYVSPNDNNNYALGKVGKHNVVIAVLPDGMYGTSSATSVARDMLHSFPNVRIGLMVGIGGGAPSPKHDIRLGDIVVSAPCDGNGGVFQYDFGKTIQGQNFQETGVLNQPPIFLLTAVNGLKAQYELKGNHLEEAISGILERNPRLWKYKRPDPGTDRLYKAEVIHDLSCAAVCSSDSSKLILRCKRTENEDNPAIHYGLIASANQLIKDALVRDKLVAQKDVLCFEMEAAGLMNHFPCLVVRGVCDYSDSHKNKEWQGYAAMAAAAYTKHLLYRIAPTKVEAQKRIEEIVSGVEKKVEDVRTFVRGQYDQTVLGWLTPVDYAPQHNDYIRRRQARTGQWLLESDKFQTWLKTDKQTLFCPGIPGAGKTIITAIVVDHLLANFRRNERIGIAYIYCNFQRQDEQKPEVLLESLLKQLAQGQSSLPQSVKELYERHEKHRTRPSGNEISETLHSVAATYSRVFIAVDALDESQDSSREALLDEIFNLQAKTDTNIFATSRGNDEIKRRFDGCPSLEIRANAQDVKTYLDTRVSRLRPDILDDEIRDIIRTKVAKAADGMYITYSARLESNCINADFRFLLVKLHMDMLISKPTKGHIKQALQVLGKGMKGLDETYGQAMERIKRQEPDSRDLAERILAWIVHSKRPLSTLELQHALAVRPQTKTINEDYVPAEGILQSLCAGLVTIDKQSNIIRLVHYTTQKFLEGRGKEWLPTELDITTACVTYLSFDTFESGFCPTDHELDERLRSNPLYDYAARNWGYHAYAARAEVKNEVRKLVVDFLENKEKVSASSQALLAPKRYVPGSGYSQKMPKQISGAHLATYFGLKGIITLLGKEHGPDCKDTLGRTPLWLAAQRGYEAVVDELLSLKDAVYPDSEDKSGRTPLSMAAERGHKAVVQLLLLLKDTVDANCKDSKGWTPLIYATQNGHWRVIELFLASDKVDSDLKDGDDRSPLSWAAGNGHKDVTQILLGKNGVEPDSKDKNGRTPLSWAAGNGHKDVAQVLLDENRIKPDARDNNDRTPLSWAARNAHEAVVKLLLEKNGVDPNVRGNHGRTPLSLAAEMGRDAVVKLLLTNDKVKPDSKDNCGRTPLSLAAGSGMETIVKLLLAKGEVDPDVKDNDGRAPLSWAAQHAHERVVELLLARSEVDPNPKDGKGRTPLSWAAENGRLCFAVVRLLLKKDGIDQDSTDNDGRTPLSWAAENNCRAAVRLLTEGKVNLNAKDNTGRTPLFRAAQKGHRAVIEELLKRDGLDLNAEDDSGQTPLLSAAQQGHDAVVELLLEQDGVNLNAKDNSGWVREYSIKNGIRVTTLRRPQSVDPNSKGNGRTALSWAVQNANEAVVKLLLAKDGVDLNSKDTAEEFTPLSLAASWGFEAVTRLLLKEGGVELNSKDNFGDSPLCLAAFSGRKAVLKLLLAKDGVDPNFKGSGSRTPLTAAALKGYEEIVRLLLADDRVDRDPKDNSGKAPLHWAAQNGHMKVVQQLLAEKEVNPDLRDDFGWTPLLWAARNGYGQVVELLLAKDEVNPDLRDDFSWTPLSLAARNGHERVVDLLLANGNDNPDSEDDNGRTPLSWAAGRDHERIVRRLLAKVRPDSKDDFGRTPLLWAARSGHERMVELLLTNDEVEPDSRDNFGQAPLSWAARRGHERAVKLLLANGKVNPDSKDDTGRTPLSWAAENGHERVVTLLLAKDKVKPYSRDNFGRTPLLLAEENGHERVVKLLLANDGANLEANSRDGRILLSQVAENEITATRELLLAKDRIDLNSREDKAGYTLLSWAAQKGHKAIVKLLLAKSGIDPDSKDEYGQTPLSWAAANGHDGVVELLLKDDVDPNSKDARSRYGQTPLSWAAKKGHEAVVKLLLAKDGIEPNLTDNNGRTPLWLAAENGHEAVVKLLLAKDGVNTESKDVDGRTPLLQAKQRGHEGVVRLLQSRS
ncbi:hypothetical protein DL769_006845 [Monosporascus sp. CRB-8-3]|nr:hypothetical protein DL769_006845 [Monosporascus sp. CRB-8-3]